ncbi:MAG TPA: hypothetical protein VEK08_07155 [Planctomycetota bacterium]|nr:hypothetical protein [Planctomycetota bacterium]
MGTLDPSYQKSLEHVQLLFSGVPRQQLRALLPHLNKVLEQLTGNPKVASKICRELTQLDPRDSEGRSIYEAADALTDEFGITISHSTLKRIRHAILQDKLPRAIEIDGTWGLEAEMTGARAVVSLSSDEKLIISQGRGPK